MKNNIVVFFISILISCFISISAFSQSNDTEHKYDEGTSFVGVGLMFFSNSTNPTKNSLEVGSLFELCVYNCYFSASNNGIRGSNKNINFTGNIGNIPRKESYNVGYMFQNKNKTYGIIPYIGIGRIYNIIRNFEPSSTNPIIYLPWDTLDDNSPGIILGYNLYDYNKSHDNLSIGIRGFVKISEYLSISVGVGSFANFSTSILLFLH